MKIQIMISGIALAALPALAQAQATVAAEGHARTEARSETRSGESRAHGQAALQATVAANLPEAPVRRAIAEGEAKGASSAAIDRAAMSAHIRMSVAREALTREGEQPRQPLRAEIVAGADAMAAGATTAELRKIRDAAPEGRTLSASLSALAELRGGGAGANAATVIAGELRSGSSDGAISSLTTRASAASGFGQSIAGSVGGALEATGWLGSTVSAGVSAAASVGGILR